MKKSLRRTEKAEKNNNSKPAPTINCDVCGKIFSTIGDMEDHVGKDHMVTINFGPMIMNCSKTETEKVEDNYSCTFCYNKFAALNHVIDHTKTYHTNPPIHWDGIHFQAEVNRCLLQCPFCDNTFGRKVQFGSYRTTMHDRLGCA